MNGSVFLDTNVLVYANDAGQEYAHVTMVNPFVG